MKNIKKNFFYLGSILLACASFVNCSNNDAAVSNINDNDDNNKALYNQVLTNEAAIITGTYVDLAEKADLLEKAVYSLKIGDDAALTEAKKTWVVAREAWELSESFLFGPVEDKGIDPAIDSWPVDVTAINAIFDSGVPITQDVVIANNETRGFHTLEYYLWGIDGNKTASQLTGREIEYLKAVVKDLTAQTKDLADSWSPSGQNHSGLLIAANNDNYKSQQDALKILVTQMINIADEVGTKKISVPLTGNNGRAKPEEEESRFSKNSLKDFADNIRSIQNLYLGTYKQKNIQGKGITDVIAPLNSSLDTSVKNKIEETIHAIEAVPVSFTDAIYNNRPAVEKAQTTVKDLSELLEKQLIPFMSKNL